MGKNGDERGGRCPLWGERGQYPLWSMKKILLRGRCAVTRRYVWSQSNNTLYHEDSMSFRRRNRYNTRESLGRRGGVLSGCEGVGAARSVIPVRV